MTRHKIKHKLDGLEKITDFLKLVFASSNIEGMNPISTVIVAPVSSGKTTAVKQFKNKNPHILITTDSTAYGLLKLHEKDLAERKIRHIIIPDLLNSIKRKKNTADQLLMFINASSEDGIFPSKTFAVETREYIPPFGWVLCVTKEAFDDKKDFMRSVGLESRFFIVSYKYSIETIRKILDNIINGIRVNIPDIEVKAKEKKKIIYGNPSVFKKLEIYTRLMVPKDNDAAIIRQQKKLQSLLLASAYLRGDDRVEEEDLEYVSQLFEIFKEYQK